MSSVGAAVIGDLVVYEWEETSRGMAKLWPDRVI
jgi:hypothetical protein